MVDFKKLGDRANDLVEKRGGTGSIKEDAAELKEIATGEGSLADKAKAVAAAIKDPGSKDAETESELTPAASEPADEGGVPDERAERKERRAERRMARAERRAGGQDPA